MSKTKLLLNVVSDLRSLADSIQLLCEEGTCKEGVNAAIKEQAPVSQPAKPPKVSVTIEAVRAVLAVKSQSGKQPQVKELILKYGANKLTDIDPARYEALLQEAEAL